jgi:RimJ/RimL family protein N-acetyltransferase
MAVLRSERLRLRPFVPDDAHALAGYRSDPEVARYQGWDAPFPLEAARTLIAECAMSDAERPGWFQWALELATGDAIVGDLGVNLLEDCRQAEIGFTIAPAFQRRGYATESVSRMLQHLLVERGLHRVRAECDARNTGSQRLLERVGFRREGHLRSSTWSKGEWCDDYLYGLLAEDWPGT